MFKCEDCGHVFENETASRACPKCGSGMVYYTAAGNEGARSNFEGSCPWEERKTDGMIKGFVSTVSGCLFSPTQTFARMRRQGDMKSPLLFGVITYTIAIVAGAGWQFVFQGISPQPDYERLLTGVSALGLMVLAPVLALFAIFLGSGILHLCLLMVGAGNNGFEATLRALCYGHGSTSLLGLIPVCGSIIGAVWGLAIQIIGLRELHDAPLERILLAVFLPLILCCGIVGIILVGTGVLFSGFY